MPRGFETNRELASLAGKKGKRKPDAAYNALRERLTSVLDLEELRQQMAKLSPSEYVRFQIDILKMLLPRLREVEINASIDSTVNEKVDLSKLSTATLLELKQAYTE